MFPAQAPPRAGKLNDSIVGTLVPASARRYFIPLLIFALGLSSAARAEGPRLSIEPDALFFRQVAGAPPPPQHIQIASRNGTLRWFTVVPTTITGGAWLNVSPVGAMGPRAVTVSVNPAALADGQYSGYLTINADRFAQPARVKVVLEVASAVAPGAGPPPAAIARPDELRFRSLAGGPACEPRMITLLNPSDDSTQWSVETSFDDPSVPAWLSVTPPSPDQPNVLVAQARPFTLAPGEYRAQIRVAARGVPQIATVIPVTLEVEGQGVTSLAVTPAALGFLTESTSLELPGPRLLTVSGVSPGAAWEAEASVLTGAASWLSISKQASGAIRVAADPRGLPPGLHGGKIVVRAGADTVTVPVCLRVLDAGQPLARVFPKALLFDYSPGQAQPAARQVQVRVASATLRFTATAMTAKGGDWLAVSPESGPLPTAVEVSLKPGALGSLRSGVYTGLVELRAPGTAQPVSLVHVLLRVRSSAPPVLSAEPGGLCFLAAPGRPVPEGQNLVLRASGAGAAAWTAHASTASGGPWLRVSQVSGTVLPGAHNIVGISADGSYLPGGTYQGSIVFSPAASGDAPPVRVPVCLIVGQPVELLSNPAAGTASKPIVIFTAPADRFIAREGESLPVQARMFDASGSPLAGAQVMVRPADGGAHLLLSDQGGGLYTGEFRGMRAGPLTLVATAEGPASAARPAFVSGAVEPSAEQAPLIFLGGVVNSASFAPAPTPLAPGSIFSLFGLDLASTTPALASSVPLPLQLGGVSVTVAGYPAPLLSVTPGVQSDQINAQLPYELADAAFADVVVNNNGVFSAPEFVWLASASPGMFTMNQRGAGALAALHADFHPVSSGRSAVAGETILLFATGLGAVRPVVATGSGASGATPVDGEAAVSIGGRSAQVIYVGLAPGFAGLYQLNVVVPDGLPPGEARVTVSINGIAGLSDTTLAVGRAP